jgi:DNA mismatch endonuclease (patch repair protein)
MPKSRLEFWRPKLERNRVRDLRIRRQLRRAGWRVLVIWECQARNETRMTSRIREFLDA